jgi:phosphoribosylanthranilate isomerase
MPVRIKICGITTPADAELAVRLGADALGLNFYSQSPRHVTPDQAAAIVDVLPPFVEPVALFVNEGLEAAQQVAHRLGIRCIQYYGEHHGAPFAHPLQLIPAFAVSDEQSLNQIRQYVSTMRSTVGHPPAAVLVDAHVPGMHGGTGQTAPWHLLVGFDPGAPVILAGGLTPENVADAVRIVRPYGVDVASGVESSPGRKDPEKLRQFIDNARAVA